MPSPLNSQPGSLFARVLGILRSPRTTFVAVARAPRWWGVVTFTFLVTTACTAMLFETGVGQLAILDQWERTASALGRTIDDRQYAAMEEASQHGAAYAALRSLVSGPLLAVGVSGLFFSVLRPAAPGSVTGPVTYLQVLAGVSHAGVILALGQVIAAPIAYARETLASPVTVRAFFAMLDEGSLPARFFGILDLFVIWWIVVLAVGMSVLYQRPARRLAVGFVGA